MGQLHDGDSSVQAGLKPVHMNMYMHKRFECPPRLPSSDEYHHWPINNWNSVLWIARIVCFDQSELKFVFPFYRPRRVPHHCCCMMPPRGCRVRCQLTCARSPSCAWKRSLRPNDSAPCLMWTRAYFWTWWGCGDENEPTYTSVCTCIYACVQELSETATKQPEGAASDCARTPPLDLPEEISASTDSGDTSWNLVRRIVLVVYFCLTLAYFLSICPFVCVHIW